MRPDRSVRFSLLVAGIVALAGCSAEPAPVATNAATKAAAAAATPRPASGNPAVPGIVSVSPETFSVTNGHATWQGFDVAYTISHPDRVDSARLQAYASEYGVLSHMDVPVQESGTVRFMVEPKGTIDLGPTVRFRAFCSEGRSEWYELGQEPQPNDAGTASDFKISGVAPRSIKNGPDDSADSNQRGVGTRIKIFGKQLKASCSIEAQVDGSTVQLNNLLFLNGHFEGLLMRRDHNYRPVSPRYVELKFSIRGKGLGKVAIKNLPFLK